jgi:hypothetical protein
MLMLMLRLLQGHEGYSASAPKGIFVHGVTDEEVRPKPGAKK